MGFEKMSIEKFKTMLESIKNDPDFEDYEASNAFNRDLEDVFDDTITDIKDSALGNAEWDDVKEHFEDQIKDILADADLSELEDAKTEREYSLFVQEVLQNESALKEGVKHFDADKWVSLFNYLNELIPDDKREELKALLKQNVAYEDNAEDCI